MHYSQLTQRIDGEGAAAWTLHFEAQARREAGEPIVLLSVGDSDFHTPEPIVEAAIASLHAGHTHYPPIEGIAPLRQAIAAYHQQRSGQEVSAEHVIVQSGAQCALFSTAHCLLDPGDEVIVIDPRYVTYEGVFGACGAHMVNVPARAANGFVVQPADIAAAITPKTRVLLINSPHNPTGAVLSREIWQDIAALCIAHDLWLISDEVYGELVFEGEHISPASLPGMAQRTATLGSLSKSHAMTGWRMGWVVGPATLIQHLTRLSLSMLYGCPEFIQYAACEALTSGHPHTQAMRQQYHARAKAVCRVLEGEKSLTALVPQAGMFVMVDIRRTGLSAQQFAERLLRQHGVCVLAGEAFGREAAGYLRLGLVLPVPALEQACERICQLARECLEAHVHG